MINAIVNTGSQPAVEVRSTASGSAAVSTSQPATPVRTTVPDDARLDKAVTRLNDHIQNVQRNLSFSIDKQSGRTVVTITDAQTKEVIKKLPPDETLRLAASIDRELANLVKERA